MKLGFKSLKHLLVDEFSPFWFVPVVGTGICSTILHSYETSWLLWCSYVMFGIASLLFLLVLAILLTNIAHTVKNSGLRVYFNKYFNDPSINIFWAFLPMALGTLTNFLSQLCNLELRNAKNLNRISIVVYSLWCANTIISIAVAWGINYLLWRRHESDEVLNYGRFEQKHKAEALKPTHLLPIIPLLVVSSTGGLFNMSNSFAHYIERPIQLSTLIITSLIWLHAIFLAFCVICCSVWSFYANGFPKGKSAYTMFLVIGPLGQASFGILLLTNNIKHYILLYLPISDGEFVNARIGNLMAAMSFKTFGFIAGLALISVGIFFTVTAFAATLSSHRKTAPNKFKFKHIQFHKGWWAMPFPLGTMAVASKEFSRQYTSQIESKTFEVIGYIYAAFCTTTVVICILGSICIYYIAWEKIALEYQQETVAKESCSYQISALHFDGCLAR
ncbi:LAQU0S12e00210g1_1 [Lachancea quebecensis]|uniref:LAQU0S12e00210g1_1 n=1 Tax=Lachancea quebecensis TaxID=1654605 RepID=A0A0P1KUL7_9SACH|nr:LAQU0S12e00210g1_1 [Lachancea quebecensis]